MPFGLRNAAQTFQKFIDEVLRDLHFSYSYIDDVVTYSKLHRRGTQVTFQTNSGQLWKIWSDHQSNQM